MMLASAECRKQKRVYYSPDDGQLKMLITCNGPHLIAEA